MLIENKNVMRILSEKEIYEAMNVKNYIGNAREIVDNIVATAENIIGRRVR